MGGDRVGVVEIVGEIGDPKRVLKDLKEFKEDNLTDWAAALTYYGILAIFPAILALVSILGLMGSGTTQSLIDNLGQVAPHNPGVDLELCVKSHGRWEVVDDDEVVLMPDKVISTSGSGQIARRVKGRRRG